MDEVERVERLVREKLRQAVERGRERCGPLYVGVCLKCGQRVPAPERWCDGYCHRGWVARK